MKAHSVRIYCCVNTESHLRCALVMIQEHDASWHILHHGFNTDESHAENFHLFPKNSFSEKVLQTQNKAFLNNSWIYEYHKISISRSRTEGAFKVLLKTQLNLHLLHIRVAFFSFTDVEMWLWWDQCWRINTMCKLCQMNTADALSLCFSRNVCSVTGVRHNAWWEWSLYLLLRPAHRHNK